MDASLRTTPSLLRWRHREGPEHPTRERLTLLVAAKPGIHFSELRRQLNVSSGTLRHHLLVMQAQGSLVAHASAGYTMYFPARGTARGLTAAAPALKAVAARRLLQEVVSAGGLTVGKAALVAGLTRSTASYHLRRLSEAGLVIRQRRGRVVALLPTALAGDVWNGVSEFAVH